jgi:ATP-binding cassette subfamily C protein CydCD
VRDRAEGPEPVDAGVVFDDVTFTYPGTTRIVHGGLGFAVPPGGRVGFVGASGSGKSTIARLLLRFHDPDRGRITIGGRDLRELSLGQIRGRIAVVSQDTWLFHGTVEDNIRMGRPEATTDELRAAARAANAEEFIERLPQGYATVVGERGVRLSGGQRQRIAIARALLRDAPILVLDEALSSVDAESEALIQAALDRLMVGRTTIIFAHRLSSIVGADTILVLDHGRVVERGTHAQLLGQGGVYAHLMAAQARDGAGALAVDPRVAVNGAATNGDGLFAAEAAAEPPDAIVEAGEIGWRAVLGTLLAKTRGYRGRLTLTFGLGIARVTALIGIGALGALAVRAVSRGESATALLVALVVVAPLAGVLHWLESWLAHDVAYRLLADMRLEVYRKLDALAPAYLTRRRTGDLAGVATHDVELIEYFFAHTVTPALVAVLLPAAVLVTLIAFAPALALVLVPFLLYTALIPVLGRAGSTASARGRARPPGAERARRGHRAGAGRDRGLRPRARVGRAARGQGAPLLRPPAAVPARSRPPERAAGDGHRARRSRRDGDGRLARPRRPSRRGGAAAADAAGALGLRAAVGSGAGRPPAGRHARLGAALHVVEAEPVPSPTGAVWRPARAPVVRRWS